MKGWEKKISIDPGMTIHSKGEGETRPTLSYSYMKKVNYVITEHVFHASYWI